MDIKPTWMAMADENIAMLERNMQRQIDVIMYGYKTYLDILKGLGGASNELANTVSNATSSIVNSWGSIAVATPGGGSPSGWGISSYQYGTPFVPKTGLAMLHKGEAVIPANQNTYNTFSPSISMTVQGGGDANVIAQEVENVLYNMGRQFKRRGFEIIPGRG